MTQNAFGINQVRLNKEGRPYLLEVAPELREQIRLNIQGISLEVIAEIVKTYRNHELSEEGYKIGRTYFAKYHFNIANDMSRDSRIRLESLDKVAFIFEKNPEIFDFLEITRLEVETLLSRREKFEITALIAETLAGGPQST